MANTGGALIYGGELEEQDPYATRKRLFDEFMKSLGTKSAKKEEKPDEREALEKFIKQVKERYEGQ